ncbi:MAG: hypothetical protein K8R87_11890, partial [Verrucomicrobia bacterium]|nr:hypothetical protein [Verrucomicrobiota bacterium]
MLRFAIISFLLILLAAPVCAEENPLRISLVSEVTAIVPGEPFYVGLNLQHREGDHTYWKFPGIVGVPTGIEWKLPEGFQAGPIEWPAPHQVLMFEIKAQGYEGDTLLPVKITPPKNLRLGTTVVLSGQASWMCCGRVCNPGVKNLTIEMKVAPEGGLDEKWHAKFNAARAAAPQQLVGWNAEAKRSGAEVQLRLIAQSDEAKQRAAAIKEMIFFTDDGLINADKPQTFSSPEPGVLMMKLIISEYATDPKAKELSGVLQTPQGWSPDGTVKSVFLRVK